MDKLWEIKKDEHGINHWTINDSFDTSSCKTITIKCDYIEQTEIFLIEDKDILKDGQENLEVIHNQYFHGGEITVPIEDGFDTSFIINEQHQFSIYDLDGQYSFHMGGGELNMEYDEIECCLKDEFIKNKKEELGYYNINDVNDENWDEDEWYSFWDDILYEIGTDTDTCYLKGKIEIE